MAMKLLKKLAGKEKPANITSLLGEADYGKRPEILDDCPVDNKEFYQAAIGEWVAVRYHCFSAPHQAIGIHVGEILHAGRGGPG